MATETAPRPARAEGFNWLGDFEFGPTALVVRSTGARVPYTPEIISQVTAWFRYFFSIKAMRPEGEPFTIAFSPARARPWYLVWAVSRLAGGKLVTDPARADVVMHFHDATYSPNSPPPRLKANAKLINFGCQDVSKTRVAKANETAFGYPLFVDPRTHVGSAVEKSEINAAHDGRIIQCPATAQAGRAYQKVIDNRSPDPEIVEDLRTCTVGGRPVLVFIKRRAVTKRFQNTNCEVLLRTPEEIFSAAEIGQIGAFTRAIGLDWGGVDVLRDRGDGRIYVVDANKTDMGPPVGLNLPDKLKAARMLAAAFGAFVRGQ